MKEQKVRVYYLVKLTKKQFLIIESICMVFFIGMAIFTLLYYDQPADSYEGIWDRWGAKYSVYIWIACILMVIIESQFYLHRFTKEQMSVIEEQKKHLEQSKSEIETQRDNLELLNAQLSQKNEEIESQRDEICAQRDTLFIQKEKIEFINKEITDSIHYACRIQAAILPKEEFTSKYIPDHFVLFKPKDIVSGDFYWMTHIEGKTVIAVADCTGHGVPGAFMSMLGAAFLNEIVNKEYISHPGVILGKLRKEVVHALHQRGESGENKDGMDIALCSINMESLELQFAGANNPLYIIKNSDQKDANTIAQDLLIEVKGDKMPIGIYERMDKFTTHEIKLHKGDCLYMFSDGFADQFGGTMGKKFKYKPFKELLVENVNLPMKKQKEMLDNAIENWMKPNIQTNENTDKFSSENDSLQFTQIDDIVVFGIKI